MSAAPNQILALNAGSSSLKAEVFRVRPSWQSVARLAVEGIGREQPLLRLDDGNSEPVEAREHGAAADIVLGRLRSLEGLDVSRLLATAHRVVHGGELYSAPAAVTDDVLAGLESLRELAPLHNPAALAVLHAVREQLPGVPAVAVFDTAFFRDLPETARVYALPAEWTERRPIRRYGFHGIAHEYLYARYRTLARSHPSPQRVISLHLGQGCSATALRDGRPVETSMGYTPLEGLIMGTRSGDVDAGILLERARGGATPAELDAQLNRVAGLLGLSGTSDDMRTLLELEAAGDARAALAIAAFCHRAHKYLGAYAAVLGGVDAVVFGGGIGENSAAIRSRVCAGLAWLGLKLDHATNEASVGREAAIAAADSSIGVYTVPVREETAIARSACACLGIRVADA